MTIKQSTLLKEAFDYINNISKSDENFFHKIIIFARNLELYFNKDLATNYKNLAITLYDSL